MARAVKSLGGAFLTHEHNADLRRRLRSEELSAEDYLSQLHCIAFRLLFLFIAEDRDLLHPPQADERARARYDRDHSTRRLRAPDAADRGSDDTALWRSLCRVTTSLGSADGSPELGLPGLGTFLWSDMATPDL
ncbi:MAG: SAM-dependent DNA methyltransferase, partial [Phycisphaerales bacterium JB041]